MPPLGRCLSFIRQWVASEGGEQSGSPLVRGSYCSSQQQTGAVDDAELARPAAALETGTLCFSGLTPAGCDLFQCQTRCGLSYWRRSRTPRPLQRVGSSLIAAMLCGTYQSKRGSGLNALLGSCFFRTVMFSAGPIYIYKTPFAQLRRRSWASLRVPMLMALGVGAVVSSTARNAHLRATRFRRICA
jgi:hypothetical protein